MINRKCAEESPGSPGPNKTRRKQPVPYGCSTGCADEIRRYGVLCQASRYKETVAIIESFGKSINTATTDYWSQISKIRRTVKDSHDPHENPPLVESVFLSENWFSNQSREQAIYA
jgi:hypothetical protein